uniref:GST C-terminal domain-containing protein n=1 Tax=Amorphochlora amoebiformis TaxID=1561963 RepID=A0A7S0DKF1_9EUKA|mmetsp:Transcript_32120/g.51707  ORF Transcript_32120/g.51707 Transcript_32120/m.51707 type:complete len:328 (+) Transcript_32120:33-1016(+)
MESKKDSKEVASRRAKGEFVRGVSTLREFIHPDGKFPPEADRYHLIVAYNCPWCHRVVLARAILGLEAAVSMDVLFPIRSDTDDPKGAGLWRFVPSGEVGKVKLDLCTQNSIGEEKYVVDIYKRCGAKQTSVPILYDKKTKTIVNNESAEIVRMFGQWMGGLGRKGAPELYPEDKIKDINAANEWIYHEINNGAYRAGFAKAQEPYEKAYDTYFKALEKLDKILANQKFVCGDKMTEADVRLFPTIFRHDAVYYVRMKLNKAFIFHYPNLWRWLSDMYNSPGVASASPLHHMKAGYFGRTGNRVIPKGPPGYPECFKSPVPPKFSKY